MKKTVVANRDSRQRGADESGRARAGFHAGIQSGRLPEPRLTALSTTVRRRDRSHNDTRHASIQGPQLTDSLVLADCLNSGRNAFRAVDL